MAKTRSEKRIRAVFSSRQWTDVTSHLGGGVDFLGTFTKPKNTMVKEHFMKIIFEECQSEDPNGGIDIFFEFFTLKLF